MMDHVNEPTSKEFRPSESKPSESRPSELVPLTEAQQALQSLATQLRRPPQSLAAFSHLTADQLAWLATRVELICLQEDRKLREELHHAIPRFLRRILLGRLRSSS